MNTLIKREFASLWRTPAGWLLAAGSLLVLGWWHLLLVERYRAEIEAALVRLQSDLGVSDLIVAPFLGGLPLFAMLLGAIAALAGRATTELEHGVGLLLIAPRSPLAIALAQFLGAALYITLLLLGWLALPASLGWFTELDWWRFAAAALGLWLAAQALLATGLFMASLTNQPAVGGALAFATGLLLLLIGRGASTGGMLHWLGLTGHYEAFLQGMVTLSDIGYFATLTAAALALSAWRLPALREG